jgi:hypothetical protein
MGLGVRRDVRVLELRDYGFIVVVGHRVHGCVMRHAKYEKDGFFSTVAQRRITQAPAFLPLSVF